MGGTDTTLGDEDIMIDVKVFYSNHLEEGHQEFPSMSVDKRVPIDYADA